MGSYNKLIKILEAGLSIIRYHKRKNTEFILCLNWEGNEVYKR